MTRLLLTASQFCYKRFAKPRFPIFNTQLILTHNVTIVIALLSVIIFLSLLAIQSLLVLASSVRSSLFECITISSFVCRNDDVCPKHVVIFWNEGHPSGRILDGKRILCFRLQYFDSIESLSVHFNKVTIMIMVR